MTWVFLVLLPAVIIIGGILFFNIYLRKQVAKDTAVKPFIDTVYVEAERTRSDDEDMIGLSNRIENKVEK